jgi:hypothetical protein
MEIIGAILLLLAVVFIIFGGIWFLVAAFRESIWWGLACLFLPFVTFFFLIVHWPEAKRPFLFQLLGFAIFVVGVVISPQTFHR